MILFYLFMLVQMLDWLTYKPTYALYAIGGIFILTIAAIIMPRFKIALKIGLPLASLGYFAQGVIPEDNLFSFVNDMPIPNMFIIAVIGAWAIVEIIHLISLTRKRKNQNTEQKEISHKPIGFVADNNQYYRTENSGTFKIPVGFIQPKQEK